MSSYPPNGTHVDVTIIDWVLTDGCTHSLLAVDDEKRTYIHWLPDDKRWDSSWKKYVGEINLKAVMRCGRKEGPRGLTAYMVDIVLPKSEQQPAPNDAYKALIDDVVESIEPHIPAHWLPEKAKPEKKTATCRANLVPPMDARCKHVSKILKEPLYEVVNLCLTEGRTPEALLRSRGYDA